MRKQKLSQWAKEHGYSYHGAYYAFRRGDIDGAYKLKSGAIMVDIHDENINAVRNIAYARVSSSQNKDNLITQLDRVKLFMNTTGVVVDDEVKDIGSGLNENRRGLDRILDSKSPINLYVEHKDRLTRFGFAYIERIIQMNGGSITIINKVDDSEDDVMQDFVSIVTSFCARIYGKRRMKRKTEQMIEVLNTNDS